ncbi:TIGR01244 family phosphatase [Marinomonas sp. M1K-6]|uniref:TIGR01244 family phosphatase n=1 Tax=Marinomonas profundi TaxID=2726122 RepID=A0A847R8V6_9GAMM|nr:TIGR01244 family sulfur transferase [Marinomonas profundi]NLQ18496.1 TIGR01244 family phosphatase [Marinomonas profundi]UDV02813.1 TIGR01244 family phosphatase [Marinomonas profundi]
MSSPVQLDVFYFVAPQLVKADLAYLKAQGFERIINNRPEAESEDQPTGESLRIEAEALGLEYVSNPIDLSKLSQDDVDLQGRFLESAKKTLAFCRTGTRSSVLWVLLEQGKGGDYSELVAQVSGKGFDLSRCAPAMAPLVNYG